MLFRSEIFLESFSTKRAERSKEGGKQDGGAKCTPVVAESISSILFDLVCFLFEKGNHSMKVLEV